MSIQRLLIDSKQPSSFQHTIANAFPDAVVTNLGENSGDVLVQLEAKTIAIEVKEVASDFLASVTDRRIFRQAEGIRYITPWAFLLLSNDFTYNSEWQVMGRGPTGYGALGTWKRSHIEGVLRSVQARGVIVETAYQGYVDAIKRIVNWVETADEGAITTEPIKLSPFDTDSQETINLLAWFHGIGLDKAKSLIKWAGKLPRYKYLELATTPFVGDNKPVNWSNETIKRNREQMQYPNPRTEWLEEALDE